MIDDALTIIEIVGILLSILFIALQFTVRGSSDPDISDSMLIPVAVITPAATLCLYCAGAASGIIVYQNVGNGLSQAAIVFLMIAFTLLSYAITHVSIVFLNPANGE